MQDQPTYVWPRERALAAAAASGIPCLLCDCTGDRCALSDSTDDNDERED